MPFSGTGVFTRVYQWEQDAANGIFVDATRTDTDSNDIAAGLTNCVTRDGQSPWIANIPAGGFKITGLANGSNNTDSVNYGQVFNAPVFTSPSLFANPPDGDNSLKIPSTSWVNQVAFSAALPAQSLGFLISNGTAASFSVTFTGFAVNEVKGADIASAATINLTTATGNLVHVTGTTNISAITIPSGAQRTVVFDGILTLVNGANLILPTGANITTAVGDSMIVRGDSTGVARVVSYQTASGRALAVSPLGDHEIVVHTGNGYGSTNTVIRRFTTTLTSVGTAITYADSATLGSTFTINETGLYSIYYADDTAGSSIGWGISLNSAQLTTAIQSIAIATRLAGPANTGSGSALSGLCRIVKLTAGDVIRAHTNGAATPTTTDRAFFAIRKVGFAP